MNKQTINFIWLKTDRALYLVYGLAAILVSAQHLLLGRKGNGYTSYENYLIFKNSFHHLVQGLNPYASYPAEQWDLFKYSPSFALFMAPFSAMPDWLGLPCWNLLNALGFLFALLNLPIAPEKRRFVAWFVLLEMITSIQNSQSNGLSAALILFVWVAIERSFTQRAGLWISAGAFLKIFGALAALPALHYPDWKRSWFWGIVAGLVFLLLPLIVIAPAQLLQVYQWWWELLQSDHQASIGLSVAGMLDTWFGLHPNKQGIVLLGFVVLLVSIAGTAWKTSNAQTRLLSWASLLIWVVIFNHKAESPTFVIALTGVALWYVSVDKPTVWYKAILAFAFVLVSLSSTDLAPRILLDQWIKPYVLKAVPCILTWMIISYQLLKKIGQSSTVSTYE